MSTIEYVAPRYLSAAETAKLVRQALKREFPGVKFSVRSSRGSAINIDWTDGPTGREVDRVVGVFAGGGFDGMIDMRYSSEAWIEQDGTVHFAGTRGTEGSRGSVPSAVEDPRTPGAQLVRFGNDFVFTHRSISDEWQAGIFRLFSDLIGRELEPEDWTVWQTPVPLAVDRTTGQLYRMVDTDTDSLSCVYHQFTGARQGGSLYISGAGAVT